MIPYGRQDINEDDIKAVADVLRSDFLTQGPVAPRFEKTVAAHVGAEYAISVNSATSALHIACLAIGLGPGDWLWTSPITFVASSNCGLYCGANVDFIDINPFTYNMSLERLKEKLIVAEKLGRLPKVVVPVHLCGQACEMAEIHALSKRYGFKVIEDASHAIGGRYKNELIGNGRYSDITIFSFHPVKIITTGEGGMALTNNSELAHKMSLFRSHGITRNPSEMTQLPDGPWYYQQIELGYNYRMAELQAALGLSQMARLDEFVQRRRELASRYDSLLRDLPIVTPWQHEDSFSAFHLYVIRLELEKINKSHIEIFETLRNQNIGVNLHYIPVYRQPYYQRMGFNVGDYSESERYYSESISLPIYPTLAENKQDSVISALKNTIYS